MFIEKWKDTAFGSDYGGDFQQFLENLSTDQLTLSEIYTHCDLKKYFDQPDLLLQRLDQNVYLQNSEFTQSVHYEDAVIALTAIVAECEMNGYADLSLAYGAKKVTFEISSLELLTLKHALSNIYDEPDRFVLFSMLDPEGRQETLSDLREIIDQLDHSISRKKEVK